MNTGSSRSRKGAAVWGFVMAACLGAGCLWAAVALGGPDVGASGAAAAGKMPAAREGRAPSTREAHATQPADARPVHKVKTAEALVAALGPDRIIELSPGDYVLSKVKPGEQAHVRWVEAYDVQTELVARKVPNLAIRCPGDVPAHIMTEHAYAFVLTFQTAPGLELTNLKIGHAPEAGYCTGGVVQVSDSNGVALDRCVLYGCGTEGVRLDEVSGFSMRRSVIENCTYGILTATNCRDLRLEACEFRNNMKYHGFVLTGTRGVAFVDCIVRDNSLGAGKSMLFKPWPRAREAVRFTGGQIVDNGSLGLCQDPNLLVLEGAKVEGNSWQANAELVRLRGAKVARPEGGWIYHTNVGEAELWDVAVAVYGDGNLRSLLAKANPRLGKVIRPDTEVVCPPPPAGKPPKK
jgi:hypothetical protein